MIDLFRSLFAPPRHLILLLAALWIGLTLAEKRVERHNLTKDALNNLVYYGILGYILGGRILFVLGNLPAFSDNPLNIFSLNIDLFDPVGALAIAVIVGFAYGQRQKLFLWSTLDALTPFFGILAIGLSLAHLAAGTAFGSPTDVPWGMEMWNATRHPTQVYALIVGILIFAFVWFRNPGTFPGSEFLWFTSLTAGAHLFLEAFRGDSTLVFGGLRLSQIVAWLVLAAALFAFDRIRASKGQIPAAEGSSD
ncbi:MAG TPA: prolipoprotein diacylglyceryl transferase family protein [Anaerolineales bacterium]|nr:prolipoprotein diacylglyceryl transferase family protein [Anaerolineales bacterium]